MALTRRDFIKVVSVAGGGLMLKAYMPNFFYSKNKKSEEDFTPAVFIKIDSSNVVTLIISRPEMGQGARTAVAMLLSEELEADWEKIKLEMALAHPDKYGSMTAGGSTTVRMFYTILRKAGATAKDMLLTAAGKKWNIDKSQCFAKNGRVYSASDKKGLSFGELADDASKLPVPDDAPLKNKKDFVLLEKPVHRLDMPEKLAGKPVFGIDFEMPEMIFATVVHSPYVGGKLLDFDSSAADSKLKIFKISNGIAICGDSTWKVFDAKNKIKANWENPEKDLSSDVISNSFKKLGEAGGTLIKEDGNFDDAFKNNSKKLEAEYELPFLAHAPMEAMNCSAYFQNNKIEVWAPTQSPQPVQSSLSQIFKVPIENVFVHSLFSGGGFGRRLNWDYPIEAVEISAELGKPVKVVWNRPDDMQNDFYRPASLHKLAGVINEKDELIGWKHHVISPSIRAQRNPDTDMKQPDAVDGALQLQYVIPNFRIDFSLYKSAVPVGAMRSVYNSQTAFANESFIDEAAVLAGKDPFEFRRKLLPEDSRLRKVLEKAAEISNWNEKLLSGKGRGIACHFCFGSYVSQVVQVSSDASGKIKVEKVFAAVDCGKYVNPDGLRNQIEGGIVFALSAAMQGAITVEGGSIKQKNFDTYEPLRYNQTPEIIEIAIIENDEAPGGMGEPCVPCIAPALCNAIFAATGNRIRKLPVYLKK